MTNDTTDWSEQIREAVMHLKAAEREVLIFDDSEDDSLYEKIVDNEASRTAALLSIATSLVTATEMLGQMLNRPS